MGQKGQHLMTVYPLGPYCPKEAEMGSRLHDIAIAAVIMMAVGIGCLSTFLWLLNLFSRTRNSCHGACDDVPGRKFLECVETY